MNRSTLLGGARSSPTQTKFWQDHCDRLEGSPEAVRALTASLPSVQCAEAVWLVTVRAKERDSIEPAIEYLEWNGVSRVRHYDVPDRPIRPAGRLLDAAQTCGAGLLVMGGYGRKPRRRDPGGAERDDDAAAPDALNGVDRNMPKMRCRRTLNGIGVDNRLDDRLAARLFSNRHFEVKHSGN